MNQDIRYSGYTTNPSDYDSQDGQLALSLNAINDNGAIVPLRQPEIGIPIPSDHSIYIHKTQSFTNYILYSTTSNNPQVCWIATGFSQLLDEPQVIISLGQERIISIKAIGLILIISTSESLHYIRFNAVEQQYVYLGTKIPDIDLVFGLKLQFELMEYSSPAITVKEGNPDSDITTDESWQLLTAKSYAFYGNDGDFLHDYAPDYLSDMESIVACDYIVLDPAIVLKANTEYKLHWRINNGVPSGTSIALFGRRNGGEAFENVIAKSAETFGAHDEEIAFERPDEWYDLRYKLYYISRKNPRPRPQIGGILSIYEGLSDDTGQKPQTQYYIPYTQESYQAVKAAVNKFINERALIKSRFIYPFFIRYAVKLFDGSYGFISAPALLIPNSGFVPAIGYRFNANESIGSQLTISSFVADIQYRLVHNIPEEWADLISGIDIFASQQIWSYDQGKEYDSTLNLYTFSRSVDSFSIGVPQINGNNCDSGTFDKAYLQDFNNRYALGNSGNIRGYLNVAKRPQDDIHKDLISVDNFYHIATIDLESLQATSNFTALDIPSETIRSLVTHETLIDNISHYAGYANAGLFAYNSRIHIYGASVKLPQPTLPSLCNSYIDQHIICNSVFIYVWFNTVDGPKLIKNSYDHPTPILNYNGSWIFYPDSRAYRMAVALYDHDMPIAIAILDLKSHDFLNGSYWMAESIGTELPFISSNIDPFADKQTDILVKAPTSIYVSEVNNPFSFPLTSMLSVGDGEVLALSSAAKALSQGQFGQFPLYAFTSEGIWALELSATGSYYARQPITRDVCINPAGITQIDSAVLFPSDRGIMLLSGSETQCVTDAINSDTPFDLFTLPQFHSLHSMIGQEANDCIPIVPFRQFLIGCRMIYDYTHQHIIAYNPSIGYAYVYSMKSNQWGMIRSSLTDSVNSYPQAYAIARDNDGNHLVDISSDKGTIEKQLIVTRPIKLGDGDILKTIDTIIQRGSFARQNVATVLYGSRDLITWHIIWSSKDHYLRGFRGTPYKYFRIAAPCSLNAGESLSGFSVQFTPRYNNQLR